MAEESKTQFQQIIKGLAQSNGLLGRVAENTQLAAELAIDAIPQMGNGESDKLTAGIESCLKAIYAHLDEFLGPAYQFNIGMLVPIKHSLDTMSKRIKFIMEDVADTKIFVGENLDENRKFHKETGDHEKTVEKSDKEEKEKEITPELAIDNSPSVVTGSTDKIGASIESCVKAIYAHLDEFLGPAYQFNIGMLVPIKHSLDTIADRLKFIMEDVADTKNFVGENLDENRKFHKETGDFEKAGIENEIPKEKETPEEKQKRLDQAIRMDAVGLIGDFAKEIKDLISGPAKKALAGLTELLKPAKKALGRLVERVKPGVKALGRSIMAMLPEGSAERLKGGAKALGAAAGRLMPGVKALGGSLMAKLSDENTATGRMLGLGKHFANRMSGKKDEKPEGNLPAAETQTPAPGTPMAEKTAGPDAPVGKVKADDEDLPGSRIVKTVTSVAKGVGNLAKGVGEVIKDVMVNVAEGVKAFGDTKVLKGAASLLILGASLMVTVKALQEFASVKWEDMAKAGVALLGLAAVASALGDLGPEILEGAAAIVALSAATWISAKAFQEFASVDWGSVFEGIAALSLLSIVAAILGVNIEFIALGAAAIALLGIALVPFAAAAAIAGFAMKELADSFTTLSKIDLGSFLKIAAGLGVIGVAAALLGTMSPLILLGAVALGALGVALIPLAAALALAGPSMDTFADGLKKLTDIGGGNLMSVAAGIVAIGAAMAAFGAGQAAAGLGNLVSKFLTLGGDSPVDQLIKIGQAGDGIEKAAAGISNISAAMEGLSKLSKDSMDAINDFPWIRATAFAAVGGQMSAGGVSVGAVSKGAAPDTGAQMNGLQNSTSDANADMSANPIVISGAGGKGSVQNNVSSVTYNSSNIPDRTSWQLTPAYGMGMP